MTYDFITIGDIKLDTFVVLEDASVQCELKMPECKLCLTYGKKIPVGAVESQIAGSAPNVARGLARMGLKTAVASVMGNDSTRQMAYETLKQEGVDTKFIKTIPRLQSSFSVVLNYKGERTILVSHADHAYRLPSTARAQWVYVSELGHHYTTMYREVAKLAQAGKALVGFNPGAVQIKERKKELFTLIRQTSVLFVNLQEAQTIVNDMTTEVHRLLTALYQLGAKRVVITDGQKGAYGFDGTTAISVPMFPGKRVETTGAGDSFAAATMGALFKGKSFDEALTWGAVNAASVVEFVGPSKGLLSDHQIQSRLKKHPSFKTKTI